MVEQDVAHPIGEDAPDWNRIACDPRRPWPAPSRPWIIGQSWRDLLFAHWRVPASTLRPMVPAGLEIDTFDGEAWVGVIPFRISHIAPRGVPHRLALAFPELNVRTYVTARGKPGVWFFSLDAASLLAVIGARLAFHLPYFWASMEIGADGEWIPFQSRRRLSGRRTVFAGRYRPIGPIFRAAPGSLEESLTARYCLYAADCRGRLFRAEIQHEPWPLQAAEAEIAANSMADAHGIGLDGRPLLHFARGLDVVTWWPERLA
ncbi:MAG: DUF2071 domain-containing protein [Thermomicrobiales bacterium]|nr:DUF2071 domain-containing protein [Thermomicrobiales bacterium]